MKLNLPQGYISSSQISTWKYNKGQYIDKYIWKIETPPRPEMLYGKQFATWLEKGWDDAPEESKNVLEKLVLHPKPEHELRDTFKTSVGEYDFLGYIDRFNEKTFDFDEVKTGRTIWTNERAEKHLQTLLYAGILYKKTGVIPKVKIHWVPTHQVDNEIVPTGEIFVFKVKMTVSKILAALKEMESSVLEIHSWFSDYQNSSRFIYDGEIQPRR